MIKEINQRSTYLFCLFFIPFYMLSHIYFYQDFLALLESGNIQFESELLNKSYHSYFKWGYFLYVFSGLLSWIKPKLILPPFLFFYWIIQAPIMNKLNWHDQHVAFLLMITLTLTNFTNSKIPIRKLTVIFLTMFYFGAGLGKLTVGGPDWFLDGKSVQFRFLEYFLLYDAKPGLFIAKNFWLCKLISWMTALFELGMPICLFYKSLQKPFIIFSFLFLTMIYLTMKINFFIFLAPVYLVFLPWNKISLYLSNKGNRKKSSFQSNDSFKIKA